MKSKYTEIYENLYNEYVDEQYFIRRIRPFYPYEHDIVITELDIVITIKKSIERANKERSLRPDAKYFLIVNFHHLIVRPLIEERLHEFRLHEEIKIDLDNRIQEDINTIVSKTEMDKNENEISGHQIMRTIDRLWKDLKTTELQIWG